MNCRPGILAAVRAGASKDRVVEVVELHVEYSNQFCSPVWVVECASPLPMTWPESDVGKYAHRFCAYDSNLRPISGLLQQADQAHEVAV